MATTEPRARRAVAGFARLLALFALLAFAAAAQAAAPRIGVATMQPGEIFWERFGHDAIVVADPATGQATSYNFGFFDLAEPGFVGNFIRGKMRYRLVALPLEDDLVLYRDEGRGVAIQWLALTDAQAIDLARRLETNARPGNAVYTYDYFRDNCSTRVRDALDAALGGALRRQLESRSRGSSYRSESVRLASPAWWMWLGFDIGLGPRADVPLSLWEEAFVPMRLAAALRDVRIDGRPLVASEAEILPHRIAPEPVDAPRAFWPWLVAGIALGVALAYAGRRRPRGVAAAALVFWGVGGLLGALMLFIWLGTTHVFGWTNHNLLLLHPLLWLMLPGAWRILRGRAAGRLFGFFLVTAAALASAAFFLSWLPLFPQANGHWIALLLPVHLGLWTGLQGMHVAQPIAPR